MRISGLQKLTLLDYPGRTACTIFTPGCNYRCPFCHNASLVLRPERQPLLPEEEVLAFLKKRRGLLDGVTVSGGEPTLQSDLPDFLRRVKALGYQVKLDTNGTAPTLLRFLLQEGLLDCVAMDIKAGPSRYGALSGTADGRIEAVRESAALLREGRVEHEFRTTAVKPLHSPADFEEIGLWLSGDDRFFLQSYRDSGDVLAPGLAAFSRPELEALLAILRRYLPRAALRGVD